MFNHNYPYTDNHELNLDWIIKTIKDTVDQFADVKQTFEEAKAEFEETKLEFEALKTRFNELLSEFGDVKQAFEAFKEEVIALIPAEIRTQVRPVLEDMVTDGTLQQLLVDATGSMSNRNLLDNPFFTVNQRGQTSYTTNNTYTFDRWRIIRCSVTKNSDDTITIEKTGAASDSAWVGQWLPDLHEILGKNVTYSAMLEDGTIITETFVADNSVHTKNYNDNIFIHYDANTTYNDRALLTVGLRANSSITTFKIKCAKLELGTVSTLANDVAPNYAEELVKCQRYYTEICGVSGVSLIGVVVAKTTSEARGMVVLPTPMRVNPTFNYSGDFYLTKGTSTEGETVTNITKLGELSSSSCGITVASSNLIVGQTYFIYHTSGDTVGKISFSADL